MSECTDRGCRNLEWKCADCGRIASTATFGWEHKGLLSISENSIGRIEYLPNAYEWISTNNRLPEIGVFCLIHSPQREIGQFVGYLEDDREWKCYIPTEGRSLDIDWVTHWMPLPNPPEGK